jgi:large subunit ribosomal protein L10
MAQNKKQKEEALKKLKAAFSGDTNVVFLGFKGLTVADATATRRAMRKDGVKMTVAKKTLANIALQEAKYEGTQPTFSSELAVAYGADAIAPSRTARVAEKKLDGKLSILGGVFERKYKTMDEIRALAAIPPLEILRAQLAYLLISPIASFARGLDVVAKKKVLST